MDVLNDFMIGAINRDRVEVQKDNAVLDQDDFLKIIAATVSNPPFPGGGEGGGAGGEMDFMGQMIQMNMLDQMTELTTSLKSTMMMTQQQQALSLVGKNVKVAGEDSNIIEGIVQKVKFRPDGFATIQVNDKTYSLQNVTEVGETSKVEVPDSDEESGGVENEEGQANG